MRVFDGLIKSRQWLVLMCLVWMATSQVAFSMEPTSQVPLESTYPAVTVSTPWSRRIQQISGINTVSRWLAQTIFKKAMARQIQGKYQVQIRLYSGLDLLHRKAKQVSLSGNHLLYKHWLPLTYFSFKTDQTTPLFLSNDKKPRLLRPVYGEMTTILSEADLNQLLQSKPMQKRLTHVKLKLPMVGEQFLDFLDPHVELIDQQFHLNTLVNIHGASLDKALPVKLTAGLIPSVDGTRLVLQDVRLEIEGITDTQELANFVETYWGDWIRLNRLKIKHQPVSLFLTQAGISNHQLTVKATLKVDPPRLTLVKSNQKRG